MDDIPFLSDIFQGANNQHLKLSPEIPPITRNREMFKLFKSETETSRGKFIFKTFGLANTTRNSFSN